jgi:DNA-binding MarR family transcriptional regulator
MSEPGRTRRSRVPHFDSAEQEAYLNLWRTYDRLRMLEDDLFGGYGLTAQQYNALRVLRGSHPERMPTLAVASRLVSRAPDITRMIDRLAERGLVDRERPADNRRLVLIGITDAGLELLRQLDAPVRECGRKQLGHLTPAELAELVLLLHRARGPHEDAGTAWSH